MKQLLIHITPAKKFIGEDSPAVKIQIDNSLSLGWKREDIMLVTNFRFEYNGVRSIFVEDSCFCDFYPPGSKYKTILNLYGHGIFQKDEIYWLHDMDCYQAEHIDDKEVVFDGVDMALTDYGYQDRWSTGSIWFRESARDIFEAANYVMHKYKTGDEQALMAVTNRTSEKVATKFKLYYKPEDIPEVKNLDTRIRKLNKSYNFSFVRLKKCYEDSIKPLKVVHFHLGGNAWANKKLPKFLLEGKLRTFMYGENELKKVLMPNRLIKIFRYHRIV